MSRVVSVASWRMPRSTGRAACTTMRAGPDWSSGMARLPIGRMMNSGPRS
jgi:hypothetical protein